MQLFLPKTGKFAGRYLNGTLTCGLSKEDGEFKLDIKKAIANDKKVSGFFMNMLRRKNLIEEMKKKDAKVSSFLSKIEDLNVKDNELIIKTKGAAAGD